MDIIKIVLTGGPAGGKTSVLNAIKELSVNDVDSKYKNIIHLNSQNLKNHYMNIFVIDMEQMIF